MYIYKLAIRNIKRNRRRSILAVISVTLSITLVTIMNGMLTGYLSTLVKNYTKNETGHVRVSTVKFDEDSKFFPVTSNIKNFESVVQKIESDELLKDEIKIIAPRVTFGVLLSKDGKQKSALGYAGDAEIEKELLMLDNSMIEGSYIKNERDMIIGEGIAKSLGYKIGDKVKVMTNGADHALHMRKFTVVGIFRTGITMMDKRVFQIHLNDAQKLLRMKDDVQQLAIMFNSHKDSDKHSKRIGEILTDSTLKATSWTKIGDWHNMVELSNVTYNFFYFIISLLGAIIIGNIMMIVVLERKREIGITKALGLSKGTILILFVLEGVYLGVIGSGIGIALGTIFNTIFHYRGVDFSKMMEGIEMPIENVIYFAVNPGMLLGIFILGLFVAAVMSFFPAKRGADMNIIEAIRSV